MLDILKGKEPTESYLVICMGPHNAAYLCKRVADVLVSVSPTITYHRTPSYIDFGNSYCRMRFVGRNEADKAALGFRGKILYGHQVERILDELGAVS